MSIHRDVALVAGRVDSHKLFGHLSLRHEASARAPRPGGLRVADRRSAAAHRQA